MSFDALPDGFLKHGFSWFVFCWLFHCLTAVVVKPNWPRFAAKDKHIRWSFYNRSTATMHSIVVFCMTVHYYLHINPGYEISKMIQHNSFVAMTNDIMIGYLFYDLIHELNFTEKSDKETLFHHILGLATHMGARIMGSNISVGYHMMVYIAELSTPFLHLCWGMYAMGFKETKAFMVVCMLVLASYLFARIMWGPYILYHFYSHRNMWSSEADRLLYLPNILILVAFNVLNLVWYKALLVKFFGLPPNGKQNKGDPELAPGTAVDAKGKLKAK
jgi:hypothetical protein